jgi:uncharacterized protein
MNRQTKQMRRNERQISDPELISEIINKADVCRIAFAEGDYPYVVTLNYGLVESSPMKLYFHCAGEGKKLEMMNKNNYVCFQMDIDHILYKGEKGCDWGMKYKSVVGYGRIFPVSDPAEKIRGLDTIMKHYGSMGESEYNEKTLSRTTVLRLDVDELTAKMC